MTAPPAAVSSTPNVKATITESVGSVYLILQESADGTSWQIVGKVTARDRNAAIQKHAETNGNKAGTFQAVTEKQWKPVKVTPQTVTTLKFEEAK